ncbi:coilin_N domain-containing protein [Trichonephila inaurata madagascariensis]|uniref:Coilin_N domain-containing protein n=1 Tax=Trichonephila inaurata madagascariensis TaxID=2747483 RepID=A0A8X6XAH4_9ARAC|nr:coilin_N domain-containing protein [Trichonephila inaurata madagascariensis]
MNVSPHELKTIKDFKNLILKKFSLQNNDFQLYLNDGLLLEDESIIILRENDTVRLEYIEPPNLEQYNSSILDVCASSVSNSKKRKRKEFTSDNITIMSNEEKDSNKKKKHELSSKTYLAKSNMTENPSLIQSVNDYAEIENVSFGVPCNQKNKNHKSHKKKKSKHFRSESAFKSNSSIVVGNEVILIEDASKISEQDKISLHCSGSKEKTSTKCAEIENVSFVEPPKLKNKEHKSYQKQKQSKFYCGKSAFETNPCIATEKEVILCEEIINISEEDKMSLHCTKPKYILQMEEQKKDYVVFDCCEVVKATNSSSQLYQNNSFAKGSRKDLIELNENNQVRFEKQDENNKSGNFNADNEVCAVINSSQLIQGNNCKKKKRKRHRKRKSGLNSSFNNDFINESHCSDLFAENVEDGALSNIFDVDKNIKENSYKYSPSTKTIKTELSEANNIATNNIYPNPTTPCRQSCTLQVSNQNKVPETLSETLNHGNTFKSSSSSTSSRTPSTCNKQKKGEVYSREDCSEIQAFNASNCNTVSPITNNSGPPNSLKSIKSPTLNFNKEVRNCKSKFICSDCSPLDSFPGVGILIAFKILELDESYSPVISHYREGKVIAVNPQTDELEIELFQPEVKQGKAGKFENLYLDELPSCEVIHKMTLQWSTLIDPIRLCSC